ncbi:hypothetical protein DK150_550045 [Flavobacterium psychrophilum]|uniref:hypothetical protein n=1 Tax=Flavobacterium psychrophilum TaxID=96345 RepID=UPI000B7C309E|nr:hypothetical protein [Flavobacterium psychrophilum]SNA83184.1 hypothetical protein DK150_550045 [Flavobacterium psychrophilum]
MKAKIKSDKKPIQRGLATMVQKSLNDVSIDYVRMVLRGDRDCKSAKAKQIISTANKILSV